MKLIIIRVRGQVKVRHDITKALDLLNLNKKNHAAIVEDDPTHKGMITTINSFVAWGEANEETVLLLEKKKEGNKIRLSPPRKGYGRKGIKVSFKAGGALGYRGDKINDLVKRML